MKLLIERTKKSEFKKMKSFGGESEPLLRRFIGSETSNLEWGTCGVDGWLYHELNRHLQGLDSELHILFDVHRQDLYRKSELVCGGVHGAWEYCPNELADKVEKLLVGRYEAFLQQHEATEA